MCIWLIVAGCASGPGTLTGLDADTLYQRGVQAAENRKWDNAIAAFEQLMFQFPTHPLTQDARYRLGDVYYQKKEYITAATEFARLADDYPTGQYADDARFRVCETYARQSPRAPLDQEFTRSAIGHCRFLIGTFPQSEHVPRAEAIIKEMRNKLADKELRAGDVYMKMQAWDSAILTLTDMLEQYPDANVVPRALLQLYRAYGRIGYREEAQATRERLLKDFPDSPEARQVREVTVETSR
jgi:outer membrane protein assembly factor BamD